MRVRDVATSLPSIVPPTSITVPPGAGSLAFPTEVFGLDAGVCAVEYGLERSRGPSRSPISPRTSVRMGAVSVLTTVDRLYQENDGLPEHRHNLARRPRQDYPRRRVVAPDARARARAGDNRAGH